MLEWLAAWGLIGAPEVIVDPVRPITDAYLADGTFADPSVADSAPGMTLHTYSAGGALEGTSCAPERFHAQTVWAMSTQGLRETRWNSATERWSGWDTRGFPAWFSGTAADFGDVRMGGYFHNGAQRINGFTYVLSWPGYVYSPWAVGPSSPTSSGNPPRPTAIAAPNFWHGRDSMPADTWQPQFFSPEAVVVEPSGTSARLHVFGGQWANVLWRYSWDGQSWSWTRLTAPGDCYFSTFYYSSKSGVWDPVENRGRMFLASGDYAGSCARKLWEYSWSGTGAGTWLEINTGIDPDSLLFTASGAVPALHSCTTANGCQINLFIGVERGDVVPDENVPALYEMVYSQRAWGTTFADHGAPVPSNQGYDLGILTLSGPLIWQQGSGAGSLRISLFGRYLYVPAGGRYTSLLSEYHWDGAYWSWQPLEGAPSTDVAHTDIGDLVVIDDPNYDRLSLVVRDADGRIFERSKTIRCGADSAWSWTHLTPLALRPRPFPGTSTPADSQN